MTMSEARDEAWEASLQVQERLWTDAARPEGVWITVVGDSMLPTLAPGTQVRVRARAPRIGEVVLYVTASGDRGVVHRVLFCLPGVPWIVQAGDARRERGVVGVIHRRQVVGVAEIPRRLPSPQQGAAVLRLLATRALTALRRA